MTRTRAQIQEALTDAARAVAPFNPAKGRRTLFQPEVDKLLEVGALMYKREVAEPGSDPPWIAEARRLIGQREIPGPANNSWIADGWARLGAGWFNDDATPWCGFFVAHCLEHAGLPYPGRGMFARALSWADYGVECPPRLGAIGVKKRKGGGHVFFIVGETPDGRYYKALGGNQSDAVSIVDIAKADTIAVRWPSGAAPSRGGLPVLAAGTISRSEA